jgi:dTDP-4-amino-4,6-dideoxygalactose transaminase
MEVTDQVFATMLRLPIHGRMTEGEVDKVVDVVLNVVRGKAARTIACCG